MAVVASDRDDPCAHASKSEEELIEPEIEDRAPYHVLRLLMGAEVHHNTEQEHVVISICGNEYRITEKAYAFYERIAEKVRKEELKPKGIDVPLNTEDICLIFNAATKAAKYEFATDPKVLRVLFYLADRGGCGFYRVIQPNRFINYPESLIHSEYCDFISYKLGQRFDVMVYPRLGDSWAFSILRALRDAGKVVVYETDDLLSSIPDWNPAKRGQGKKESVWREQFIRECDGLIVSTEELCVKLGREQNTYVCHNGIDESLWPMVVKEQFGIREAKEKGERIGILWAGSNTHEKDLGMIVPVIRRLIKQFPQTIHFYFVGYLPPEFVVGYNNAGVITSGVAPQYRESITFVQGVSVFQWPQLLASLNVHIALAPLVECEFNECKSEIKVLESWALGLPIVASRIAPYSRAIKHDENGLLLGPNQNDWYYAIEGLIANAEKRRKLAEQGLETLRQRYMMKQISEDYERALLHIAKGRTARVECNAAIQQRLEEKKWL